MTGETSEIMAAKEEKSDVSIERLNIIPSSPDTTNCFDENPARDIEGENKKRKCSPKQLIVTSLTMFAVFLGVATATGITLTLMGKKSHFHGRKHAMYQSELYSKAAVSCDSAICSQVGSKILKQNGSAVDSAIATSFCLGVVNLYATGIGGGGFMLVYNKQNRSFDALDFRERAPGKATVEMYERNANDSKYGGRAIAVPGQVKGLYYAWKKYGNLPWKQLVQPSIELAEEGYLIHPILNDVITESLRFIKNDNGLRESLLSATHQPLPVGSRLKNVKLSVTLKTVADDPDSFYNGKLAEKIVKDVSISGGDITLDDLADYSVISRRVIATQFNELRLNTMGLPSGGVSVVQLLNILRRYYFSPEDLDPIDAAKTAKTYHRIIEALKFTFAEKTKYGDPSYIDQAAVNKAVENALDENFGDSLRQKIDDSKTFGPSYYGAEGILPNDKGTSHASVLASNGDAVAITTSINEWFGCGFMSTETGIIYNNEMADFSPSTPTEGFLPPAPRNKVHGGKRPLSSMSPIIMTDVKNGDVKMVIGGTGGGRIIASVAYPIMNKMWFGQDLAHAVALPRLYHQLLPNQVQIETGNTPAPEIMKNLRKHGHTFVEIVAMSTSAQALFVERPGMIYAMSDPRREGKTDGF